MGFAPVEDPRYVLAMIVDEPSGYAYYGSLVAAPYAGEVFAKIFDYAGLPPSTSATVTEWTQMPDVVGVSTQEALEMLRQCGLTAEVAGEGESVRSCVPSPQTRVEKGDVVLLRT